MNSESTFLVISGSDTWFIFNTINVISEFIAKEMITRYYIDGMCEMIFGYFTAHIKTENGCSEDLFTKWYYKKKKNNL
jgi:hypothetical protein